jgi:hypothetical protein
MNRDASWFGRQGRYQRNKANGGRRSLRRLRPTVLELEGRQLLATITVSTTASSGTGSLAAAVAQAISDNQANTIVFDPTVFTGHQTIQADQGEWIGSKFVQKIIGPAQGVTLNGGGTGLGWTIGAGTKAAFSNLTFSGYGYTAIQVNKATLTMNNCTVSDNDNINFGSGGLDLTLGTVTITNSSFIGNSISGANEGGTGAAFSNDLGTATFENCTFFGNSVNNNQAGGAISNGGTMTLIDCTVTGNSARTGGGIYAGFDSTSNLYDTIVAGNTGGTTSGPSDIGVSGTILVGVPNTVMITGSNNLIGTGGSGGLKNGQNGNIVLKSLANLGLASLGSYGGTTQTMALLPGSPAIAAGSASITGVTTPTTDQRGIARPKNSAPDIGAFQTQGFTIKVTEGSGQSTKVGTAFAQPLEVTVTSPHGDPVQGGIVTFTAPTTGASAMLSSSKATIGTGGLASVSPTADHKGGTYDITASAAGATPVSFALTNLVQPVFTVANEVITYGTNTVSVSGTIAAGTQFPSGNVTITLDGVAHTAVIGTNGAFSTSFTFAKSLSVASSPYTVSYAYHAAEYFLAAQDTSSLTVKPAYLAVTATNESMTYGSAVPTLTFTYTGLVNGDKSATFTGSLVTRATSTTNVGKYAITHGTLAATGNYVIRTIQPATLTINPAPLTITAINQVMPVGGPLPQLLFTITGGHGGGEFSGGLATTATPDSAAGNYPITLGTLKAIGNYTIGTFIPGTLTVGGSETGESGTAGVTGLLTDAAIDGRAHLGV